MGGWEVIKVQKSVYVVIGCPLNRINSEQVKYNVPDCEANLAIHITRCTSYGLELGTYVPELISVLDTKFLHPVPYRVPNARDCCSLAGNLDHIKHFKILCITSFRIDMCSLHF